ncbi:MAG: hypothetical protein ACXVSX_03295 [Solirubrobacteraceae bacterium]
MRRTGLAAITTIAAAAPIPQGPGAGGIDAFLGRAATPHPITAPAPPRNPHMAPDGSSNIHVDAYQSDVNRGPGPLGTGGIDQASAFFSAECASITFDARGRLVTVCVGLDRPTLRLMDPRTLDTVASYALPPRTPGSGDPLTNFAGGGYFYLDDADRAVIPTTERHIVTIAVRGDQLVPDGDIDATSVVAPTDQIISALPDYQGRIWFATKAGTVGIADTTTGAVHALPLAEPIGNSFAAGDDGVYVVTDRAMYKLSAGPAGAPVVTWRTTYDNDGTKKPGQTESGSGTTPTLTTSGYIAITDNADPVKVVVLRRSDGGVVCTASLFDKGASSTDQSLVATDNAIFAENNFGYSNASTTENGKTTTQGLQRIDVRDGRCTTAWRSNEVAPSAVPKLSLANGLLYTYTKPARSDGQDPWYLTAIDARTGKTVFKRLGGEGLGFNNNYAPITLGRDGAAYLGTLGGVVVWRDKGGANALRRARATKVALHVRCLRHGRARLTVTGARLARVTFTRDRRVVRRDRRRPFATVVRRARRVGAHAVRTDGRVVRLAKRGCRR